MQRTTSYYTQLANVVAASLLLAATPCLAKKGGNGGGKPGGGGDPPPPAAPVSYSVTPITMPGTSSTYYGNNEQAAIVGALNDAPVGGRRALAYLPNAPDPDEYPGFFSGAFYLDDPRFNLQGIPDGWHTRGAVDINNSGTIVGLLSSDTDPDNQQRPMYVTGAMTGAPTLHSFEQRFNTDSMVEAIVGVNDSSDMVVWSQLEGSDGVSADRLFIGNPVSDGHDPASWVEIDFDGQGYSSVGIEPTTVSITPRHGDGKAFITGSVNGLPFRLKSDGTELEIGKSYTQAQDGGLVEWDGPGLQLDMTDNGDVYGNALITPSKKGKIKVNDFSAKWAVGSTEYVSAIGADPYQTEYDWAAANNDGDLLLGGPDSFLWLMESLWIDGWSDDNGPVNIADLIDPNDPSGHLFYYAFELTDRDASGMPTIVATSEQYDESSDSYIDQWLILTPQSTATLTTTAVPEPASILLGFLAVSSLAVFRRVI